MEIIALGLCIGMYSVMNYYDKKERESVDEAN